MTDTRWPRVRRLFEAALERPDSERAAFLAAACAGDDDLRREVDALLAADEAGGDLSERLPVTPDSLEMPSTAIRQDDPSDPGLAAGRRLGNYEVIAWLGAGGMGDVYRARDMRLHRDVALKLLPPALVADPERRASLVQEARAASALEHPHIAVIHEIADSDGMTVIVMELV